MPWLIEIGDECTIAPEAYLLAHDASTKRHLNRTRVGRVCIGRRVFIGARAVILPGVTVGDESIVAAGSVVVHDVPPRTIVAGNPARQVGSLDDYLAEQRRRLAEGPYSTERSSRLIAGSFRKRPAPRCAKRCDRRAPTDSWISHPTPRRRPTLAGRSSGQAKYSR